MTGDVLNRDLRLLGSGTTLAIVSISSHSQTSPPDDETFTCAHTSNSPQTNYTLTDYSRHIAAIEPYIDLHHCAPCGAQVKKRGQICQRCQRARLKRYN